MKLGTAELLGDLHVVLHYVGRVQFDREYLLCIARSCRTHRILDFRDDHYDDIAFHRRGGVRHRRRHEKRWQQR